MLAGAATLYAGLGARQGRAAALGELQVFPPRAPAAFGFLGAEGEPKTLADFAGRPLLVNFWATWCLPCVVEMPALVRTQAALAAEGLVVLALSSDRGGRAVVETFYAEKGIKGLGVWLDPRGAAGRAAGVRGLPTTLVINRQGQEVARLEGAAEWDSAAMLARLRGLFAATTPA
jgi:thiol-disulfide isomerase/thioredoxin